MSTNSEKTSSDLIRSMEGDGQHNGKNAPSQRHNTILDQETSKYDPMQQWLDEKPEEEPWNSVIYYVKEENNKREEAQSDKA